MEFSPESIKTKLSRGCGLLAKLRCYVNTTTLRSVYFAIFDAHLRYGSQIWGQQKTGTIKQIEKLQDKAIRIINFKSKNDPSNPLYKSMKILKLNDVILFNNCMFVLKRITHFLTSSKNYTMNIITIQEELTS